MNRLMRGVLLGAVLATTLVATAARSAQAETIVFTAQLFTSSVVPPDSVSPSERGAFGTAIITLTITRGITGGIQAAAAQFEVLVAGLPNSSTIVQSQVHQGAAGVNGPVKVDSGIGPIQPVGGIARFLVFNLLVTSSDAVELIANPTNVYLDVRTTLSPGGVVRGQLQGPPSLQFADPIPGVTAQLFPNH